ncbi:MAG: cytidylate kinase-like family protein [Coriobacteriales bacterium]|jgi:cytidylate kinase|nr:cytidylate kinase-like family protein [Coriobacteriales bacterium]
MTVGGSCTVTRHIITISRQYGSGGREIGEKVAAALGYGYYDRELIRRAAQDADISEDLVREEGEGIMGKISSLLSFGNSSAGAEEDSLPLGERIFLAEARTIKQIAEEGPCVIIGHSADYFLADHPGLLNVYIHSDWEARVARVMARNDLDERSAVARIKRIDRKRAAFYEQHTDQRWGKASNYHLSLSSSSFGIDVTADMIVAIAKKA